VIHPHSWRRRRVALPASHHSKRGCTTIGNPTLSFLMTKHFRGFTVEGRLRRHFRRANGELWDVVTMGIVLDTQSPGSSYPDAENL
jgi:hypothetical protein